MATIPWAAGVAYRSDHPQMRPFYERSQSAQQAWDSAYEAYQYEGGSRADMPEKRPTVKAWGIAPAQGDLDALPWAVVETGTEAVELRAPYRDRRQVEATGQLGHAAQLRVVLYRRKQPLQYTYTVQSAWTERKQESPTVRGQWQRFDSPIEPASVVVFRQPGGGQTAK
jgi:hypothetical protein